MPANLRDVYKYIHDEVLRMANSGMKPEVISEEIQVPPIDVGPRYVSAMGGPAAVLQTGRKVFARGIPVGR